MYEHNAIGGAWDLTAGSIPRYLLPSSQQRGHVTGMWLIEPNLNPQKAVVICVFFFKIIDLFLYTL